MAGDQGEVRVLGRFSVRRGGQEIPASAFGGGLVRTLVCILIARRGELVSRDLLIEALWPRAAPADPGASLNVLINRARRALGEPTPLVTGSGGYLFVDDHSWAVDAEVFLARVERGRASAANAQSALREFRAALEGWGGDPLPEDAYADWAQGYRATLLRAHQECLEGAAAAAMGGRAFGEAVVFAQQAVAAEPLREAANLALVRALAAAGDQAGALAAFEDYRRRLAEELGLDPSKEAFDLQGRIIRHEPLVPRGARAGPSRPVSPSVELAFVGRDREVDAVLAALAPEQTGIVLVAGRSGAGKSRLLAEVAERLSFAVLSARAFLPERDEPWALARSLLREALVLNPELVAGLPSRAAAALADIVPDLEQLRPPARGRDRFGESAGPCPPRRHPPPRRGADQGRGADGRRPAVGRRQQPGVAPAGQAAG
jgi:DNA-binding SARP family transcriptional activator